MLAAMRASSPLSDASEGQAGERALLAKGGKDNNLGGYEAVDRPAAGLRGRRTFAFWTLVALLLLLAAGNLALTFTILGVLRLGQGMESIELVPEANAIKMYGAVDLDSIYKRDGLLQGWAGCPVTISSDGGPVGVSLLGRSGPKPGLHMNASATLLRGMGGMRVVDPGTGETVFSTAQPFFKMDNGPRQLKAQMASTNRVASPIDQDLLLRSDLSAHLRGAEGTRLEAASLSWTADQDITLRANDSVVLGAREGVYLNARGIPIAAGAGVGQFKVCVCMPQGKLFRVAVPQGQRASCLHINLSPKYNPCV